MKTPRDVSGTALAKALRKLGYDKVRQDGSHIRLTTQTGGEHRVTIPNHNPIKVGTLGAMLKVIALHHGISVPELLVRIELR